MFDNSQNSSNIDTKAHFILKENREKTFAILAYDLFMFIQLIVFYVLCFTLGLLCYLLDKITFQKIFLNGFVSVFGVIANLGKAP